MGKTGLYLSNGIGYIWAEEELHRICSIYGHGKGANTSQTITYYYGGPNDQDKAATGEYALTGVEAQQGRKATLDLDSGARALTVDDINKICGKDATYTANYSSSTVTKVSRNAKYYPTISTTNTTTGQSAAQSTFSGSYYYTDYDYTISSANENSVDAGNQNSMLKPGTSYWLASRSVATGSSTAQFLLRYMLADSSIYSVIGCSYNGVWHAGIPSCSVRAIVNLSSGVQTNDTEYNSTTGWNLAD